MGAHYVVLVGIVAAVVGSVCRAVAVATPHWAKVAGEFHFGLFKLCGTECVTITNAPGSLVAVRALVILGILGSFVGAILGSMCYVYQYQKRIPNIRYHIFALLTLFFTDLLPIIGLLVFKFIAYEDVTHGQFGFLDYSYFVCLAVDIMAWLGGSLIYRGGRLL